MTLSHLNLNRNLNRALVARQSRIKSKSTIKKAAALLPLVGLFLLPLATRLYAQEGLSDMLFTVGTTWRDAHGRDWAYLAWQASQPELLRGRTLAIYVKPGDAGSAAPYQRSAIVAQQTDPQVIKPLLNRSENLGDNMLALDMTISSLFEKLMPSGAIRLEDRVSAVIRGAGIDPEHYDNLLLLSRMHPGVGFCLGLAHAELVGAGETKTFELRDYDLARDRDRAVIGRVTVTAGAPAALPAPGRPVEVFQHPTNGPMGHLNVKLRWAAPSELRRLSLINYGFNVYRMTKAFAEARNYDDLVPSTSALLALLGSNPDEVKRLNTVPVIADKDFSAADVVFDPPNGDTNTFFFADDNSRYRPGGLPFVNGEQFYYFVTARDILGRDGDVSPGLLVKICDRMPAPAPRGVRVVNDYTYVGGAGKQRLKIFWRQNDNGGEEQTGTYYIYRWDSVSQMQSLARDPAANRIAILPHEPLATKSSHLDDGAGAPALGDEGKTFWYTVRAVDLGACGGNLSPNSVPVFGVLRDRTGPAAGDGVVEIVCSCPTNRFTKFTDTTTNGLNTNVYRFRLANQRLRSDVAWVDFQVELTNHLFFIARRHFPPGVNSVSVDYTLSRDYFGPLPVFYCRAGSDNDKETPRVPAATVGLPAATSLRLICWESDFVSVRRPAGEDCDEHDPPDPEGDADEPARPRVDVPPASAQCKFYRRVDDGPLTLIAERAISPAEAVCSYDDPALPANPSTICYYSQFFDRNGNPSPLRLLDCVEWRGKLRLPTPVLARLKAAGTAADPQMIIRWLCPPHGVERFRLFIADDDPCGVGDVANCGIRNPMSPDLSPDRVEHPSLISGVLGEDEPGYDYGEFETRRINPGSFGTNAEFTVTIKVAAGKTYTVFVHAVEKRGRISRSRRSNVEQLRWRAPEITVLPEGVRWPARDLPGTNANFIPNLHARFLTTRFDGVGVRIGQVNFPGYNETINPPPGSPRYFTPRATDPALAQPDGHLYANAAGQTVFPAVLYRYQVPNTKFPTVSGDIVQVSPMMEQIAHSFGNLTGLGPVAAIWDPFIAVISEEGQTQPPLPTKGIYLLDTQPVIKGAKYRYLLVRFRDGAGHEPGEGLGEMQVIIPTNEVDIP